MHCAVLAMIAYLASAQGPGNGLSKSTYGASPESAISGLNFLIRLFPATPAEDSPTANVALCPAGTSEQTQAWWITAGRADLVKNLEVGTCAIKYGHLTSESRTGVTSVTPSSVKGNDCTYGSNEFVEAVGGYGYVTSAHNADTCCKACASDSLCTGAVYTGSSKTYGGHIASSEGFGLHLPALPGHSTSGGQSVDAVEEIFREKMGLMERFDWFMDYNVGLFTSNLDGYLNKMDNLGINYLAASWPTSSDGTWYSVFVHVPNTQMVIELLGQKSALIKPKQTLEQRMTETRIKQVKTSPPTGMLVTAVSVSRAISDMSLVHDFYVNGARATVTAELSTSDVVRNCYQWNGAMADVCFTQRSDSMTSGSFKPKDFQDMLNANHAKYLTNPKCGMDRWEDNHYAVDLGHNDRTLSFDSLLNYVKERAYSSTPVYYTCSQSRRWWSSAGAHYVFDPSGWGIQLDGSASVVLPGCSRWALGETSTYPWCTGGTCDDQTIV